MAGVIRSGNVTFLFRRSPFLPASILRLQERGAAHNLYSFLEVSTFFMVIAMGEKAKWKAGFRLIFSTSQEDHLQLRVLAMMRRRAGLPILGEGVCGRVPVVTSKTLSIKGGFGNSVGVTTDDKSESEKIVGGRIFRGDKRGEARGSRLYHV